MFGGGGSNQVQIIVGAVDYASKVLNGIGDSGSKLGNTLKAFGKAAAVGIGAATAAATAFGISSAKEFRTAEFAAQNLTRLILNQTGATMENVKALQAQSKALARQGIVDDEAITAAQAKLATFDLQSSAIQKLIPSLLDMAVAEGQGIVTSESLVASANGLGKALQGNTELFTKQGFVITDVQKKILETGTETQRLAAINEILGKTYNGANAAMRNTSEGGLIALKNQFGDFKELVGEVIMKAINPLIFSFSNMWDAMGGGEMVMAVLDTAFTGNTEGLMAMQAQGYQVTTWMWGFINTVIMLKDWLNTIHDWFIKVKDRVIELGTFVYNALKPAFELLIQVFQQYLLPSLQELWEKHGPLIIQILKYVAAALGIIAIVITGTVVAALATLIGFIALMVKNFTIGFTNAKNTVNDFKNNIIQFKDNVVVTFGIVQNSIQGVINKVQALIDKFINLRNKASNALSSIPGGGILKALTPFQFGGVVPGRPGQAVPIMAHGGEVISNPNIGQGVTNNNNATYNVTLNSDAAVWMFFSKMQEQERAAKFGVASV